MDLHGNTVGKASLRPGVAITEMAWNCERFNMEEQPEHQNNLNIFPSNNHHPKQPQPYLRPDGNEMTMKFRTFMIKSLVCWVATIEMSELHGAESKRSLAFDVGRCLFSFLLLERVEGEEKGSSLCRQTQIEFSFRSTICDGCLPQKW